MNNEREIQRSRNGTRRISKQMMAFVMALTLVVSMLCPIIAQAANVSVQQIRVTDPHKSFDTNGWKFSTRSGEVGYCFPKFNNSSGKNNRYPLYCIEPIGTIQKVSSPTSMPEVKSIDATLSSVPNAQGLSATQLKDMLGRIYTYGFHDKTTWSSSGTQKCVGQKAQWLATQILVWEAMVGQRDANFNYKPQTSGKPVKTYAGYQYSGSGSIWSSIEPIYNEYATAIQNSYKTSTTPEFMKDTEAEASKKENVKELRQNADGTYSLDLTDTNNTIDKYQLTFPKGISGDVNIFAV